MIEIPIKLFIGHCMGDSALQPDYLAKTKNDHPNSMILHCGIYSGIMFILFSFNPAIFLYFFITHFAIDTIKARGHLDYIEDQVCHYVACTMIFFALIMGLL